MYEIISDDFIIDLFDVFVKHEIVSELVYRNLFIRYRYKKLMQVETKNRVYGAAKKCRAVLRDELISKGYSLDDDMIQKIIYKKEDKT